MSDPNNKILHCITSCSKQLFIKSESSSFINRINFIQIVKAINKQQHYGNKNNYYKPHSKRIRFKH